MFFKSVLALLHFWTEVYFISMKVIDTGFRNLSECYRNQLKRGICKATEYKRYKNASTAGKCDFSKQCISCRCVTAWNPKILPRETFQCFQ